jgi:hypothetical protein
VWFLALRDTLADQPSTVAFHYDKKIFGLRNKVEALTPEEKKMILALIWAKYTRLRQAVSHPFCLERLLRQTLDVDEVEIMRENLEKVRGKEKIIEQLRRFSLSDPSGLAMFDSGLDALARFDDTCLGGHFDLDPFLRIIENELRMKSKVCPICEASPIVEPIISSPVSSTRLDC